MKKFFNEIVMKDNNSFPFEATDLRNFVHKKVITTQFVLTLVKTFSNLGKQNFSNLSKSNKI